MTTIGLCHYKVGDTDGVSLEMEKWKCVLNRLGHTVHFCAGDLGKTEGFLIKEMYHHREDVERITRNVFYRLEDYESVDKLEEDIFVLSETIERALQAFVNDKAIEVLVMNNIWSLGANLPAAVASARVVRRLGIPAVAHHHDFYWERGRGIAPPTGDAALRTVQEYLPPSDPLISHVTINRPAQMELLERKGINATIVPNVFDFRGGPWAVDSYNRGFRESIDVEEDDILVLQATRVVERKGIELAIDLVAEMNKRRYREKLEEEGLYDGRRFGRDSRIVLVLAGYSEDPAKDYLNRLQRKARKMGIEARFISERVRARREDNDGRRMYSLWDCYVFADLVTYPSLLEGWGNQFLEAIHARLPIVLFEYPVYQSDIKGKGFDVISLGGKIEGRDDEGLVFVSENTIAGSAERAVEVLSNQLSRSAMTERNFQLAAEFYSLESLENRLRGVLVSARRE